MATDEPRATAVDLYSGIGGWALGLAACGVQTLASFEWWSPAAATSRANLGHDVHEVDIRCLDMGLLPSKVDFVVGSPPCTQFSYSNRGGTGNLADGLKDVAKFLEVVEQLQPQAWAMENVPRVAAILETELSPGGALARFSHLFSQVLVVDTSTLGLPQRRKRMIAGRFSGELVQELIADSKTPKSLGGVIDALQAQVVHDPNWEVSLPIKALTENEQEAPLDSEELRLNSDSKLFHPVYNRMAFPDRLDEPARTVTATCTRVSRESVVVRTPAGTYRRLSVRERATLQGFPISYQFHARAYGDKIKMIGNAIPPILAYVVGQAMRDLPIREARLGLPARLPRPTVRASTAPRTPPVVKSGARFPKSRRFRAAIPSLRFGSGMRFDLSNEFGEDQVSWQIGFFFGTSRSVRSLRLDSEALTRLLAGCSEQLRPLILGAESSVKALLQGASAERIQARWTRTGDGPHPHELVDDIGELARRLTEDLQVVPEPEVQALLASVFGPTDLETKKFDRYSREIISGVMVGATFNVSMGAARSAVEALSR